MDVVKNLNKKFLLVLVVIISFTSIVVYNVINSQRNMAKVQDVTEIYVGHIYFGGRQSYRINLENNEVWTYSQWYDEEDKEPEFSHNLNQKEVENVLKATSYILSWNEDYNDESETDGHWWTVIITFEDGTEKVISGYNKYPLDYEKVGKIFEKNVGLDVFEK